MCVHACVGLVSSQPLFGSPACWHFFLHRLAEEVASVQRKLCHAATSSYTNVEMTAVGRVGIKHKHEPLVQTNPFSLMVLLAALTALGSQCVRISMHEVCTDCLVLV